MTENATTGADAVAAAAGVAAQPGAATGAAAAGQPQAGAAGTSGGEPASSGTQGAATAAPAKPAGPPEKYEWKLPKDAPVDKAALEAFEGKARELGFTQEQAQGLLDAEIERAGKSADTLKGLRQGWRESAKSDKEFGGDKLREATAIAKHALARFGTPELDKLLTDTGLGDHPEIIRAFYRAGLKIAPDKIEGGKPAGDNSPKDAASVLYPAQPRKAA